MSKIELAISPNYVPTWNYVDAIRELFQNALDQEAVNPENKCSWSYDENSEVFRISNATSKLTTASLLLGNTTKADDTDTIGQFGEGYKIATLVLLREGKQVTFYNYGAKEIWRPRFVKSRKFGADLLTFFTEKAEGFWHKAPSDDLTIEVYGITPDEFKEITMSNLHIRTDYTVIESTPAGDIIDLPGKVFVNGLYVCDYTPYKYGYNFKPSEIRLDRDRKMANDFELRWLSSKMWSSCSDQEKLMELIEAGSGDVAYVADMYVSNFTAAMGLRDFVWRNFVDAYGDKSVPVTTQDELDKVPNGYRGIVVPDVYCKLVKNSSLYDVKETDTEESVVGRLQDWFDDIKDKLTDDEITTFNEILEDLNANM